MVSLLKKIYLSGENSITKWCFVTNFYQFLLFIKTFLKMEFVVFMYESINYVIIFYSLFAIATAPAQHKTYNISRKSKEKAKCV